MAFDWSVCLVQACMILYVCLCHMRGSEELRSATLSMSLLLLSISLPAHLSTQPTCVQKHLAWF